MRINFAQKFGGLLRAILSSLLILTTPIYLTNLILNVSRVEAEPNQANINTVVYIDAKAQTTKLTEPQPKSKQTDAPKTSAATTTNTIATTQTTYRPTAATPTPAPAPGRYISIPAIGVNARLLNLGLTAGGAVDTPTNLYDAGWYNGSVVPGNSGASFIDGHSPGVFSRLSALGAGSGITVGWDGQTINYRVTSVQIVALDSVDMATAVYGIIGGGNHGLNIMTCYGTYLPTRGTYSHRVIVYSVRV
jgi:LPXTG-site transpeptidase (sortase) family protein